MTQAQGRANRAGNPSLCHPLMASTLRALAMLVSIVAKFFAPKPTNPTAECDGGCVQTPEANDVLDQFRRTTTLLLLPTTTATTAAAAAASCNLPKAPMVRTIAQSAIVDSNHEGGLTPIKPQGTPPLGKGRSEHASRKAKLATGGDHFAPRPLVVAPAPPPRPQYGVIPTPTSLRESRTSPFQGEEATTPA